jgi:hypothetical protein
MHQSLRPRRRVVLPAALLAVAAGLVFTGGGSAQTPGARTVSLFETDTGSTFALVDNAPKSPVANPESRRFRFSMGDKLLFGNPVLDQRGGNRLGVIYGEGTVMRGRSFANAVLLVTVTFAFSDGSQISGVGGAYEGARGTIVSQEVQGGSQDTLTLLP